MVIYESIRVVGWCCCFCGIIIHKWAMRKSLLFVDHLKMFGTRICDKSLQGLLIIAPACLWSFGHSPAQFTYYGCIVCDIFWGVRVRRHFRDKIGHLLDLLFGSDPQVVGRTNVHMYVRTWFASQVHLTYVVYPCWLLSNHFLWSRVLETTHVLLMRMI